jgi:hypothetical protein
VLGPVIERCTATNPIERFADVAALRSALVVALVSPISTAQAPKIQEWINSLVNEPTSITAENYEEIVRYMERDAEPANSVALLYAFDIVQIEHLHQSFPHLFGRLVPLVCKWVRTDSFEFAYCDVLGSRLEKIHQIGSIREKAESAIAALELGYSHNRFSLMRRFFRMIDQAIGQDLADRLAIDLAVMGQAALSKIEEIERQVSANRDDIHPKIQMILKELKNQYEP